MPNLGDATRWPKLLRSAVGTSRTWPLGLTMSVLEGKANFPVARPDFPL